MPIAQEGFFVSRFFTHGYLIGVGQCTQLALERFKNNQS
jgi:hypothetical protein